MNEAFAMWQARAHSALGIVVILLLAWAVGALTRGRAARLDRGQLRAVGGGLVLLLGVALLVLKSPAAGLFTHANDGVEALLGFAASGNRFMFGDLANATGPAGYVFAIQVLPTIVFFSALMSVAYHLGIMPWIVQKCGFALSRLLKVSGAESLSTVADVFVGQAEAPLVIRPYVARMTLSELNACMVAGYATTAGGVLAAYVSMLSNLVPGIAGHLIAASVMGAPAALVIAKLLLPESEQPETSSGSAAPLPKTTTNLIDAITQGTVAGLGLALNIGATLIVFLAFTNLVDALLTACGQPLGVEVSLNRLFTALFYPLAWLLGIPQGDVGKVAALLGTKTVLNEFIAYTQLTTQLQADPNWLDARTRVIASYALCGFANFGSVGIQVAAYTTLAPERSADVSRLALRAMFGGLLATCLIACVTGVLL